MGPRLFWGKSRLVKWYDLARRIIFNGMMTYCWCFSNPAKKIKPDRWWHKVPTSTGEGRISEPWTVCLKHFLNHQHFVPQTTWLWKHQPGAGLKHLYSQTFRETIPTFDLCIHIIYVFCSSFIGGKTTNQPTYTQPTNQYTTNQPIHNQPTNQPTNQPN